MAAKQKTHHASEKAVVYAAARRHHIPGWLLWGMYGAENSWTYSNGVPFGLIESNYPQLNQGKGRSFHNTGLPEAADVAAELLASLKKEHGSLSAAVTAYSGGDYSLNHPRELSRQNHSNGKIIPVNALGIPPGIPLPGLPGGTGSLEIPKGIESFGKDFGGSLSGLPGVGGALGSGLDSLTNIAAFFRGLGELFLTPAGWLRLAKLGGGAILFLWGLKIFVRNSTGVDAVKQGSKIKGTVEKAVDAAAVVATVK